MQTWLLSVIWVLVGVLIGLFFPSTWGILSQIASHGFKSLGRRRSYPFVETRDAKLVTILFALLSLSIASWFIGYYVTQQQQDQIWSEIANAVFGISTAGLLGGIVFEMFLRREILAEVSETLAEIVTTDKNVAREIFTEQKINKIIETMLQINTGNDVYGSALYSDFVAKFTDRSIGYDREFRFDFKDSVTFCNIDPKYAGLTDKYYEVIDKISYRAELRQTDVFIVGCASTEDQLYALFSDSNCIYRWLLKADDFETLMNQDKCFSVSLTIDGIECERLNGQGELGERGFEIHFKNPFFEPAVSPELGARIGRAADFRIEIETHTLQAREKQVLSVHLAYPVKGAEIVFDYEQSDIRDVTWLHFLTAGRHNPRVETGVVPYRAPKQNRKVVTIRADHWIFPDSGVVLVW